MCIGLQNLLFFLPKGVCKGSTIGGYVYDSEKGGKGKGREGRIQRERIIHAECVVCHSGTLLMIVLSLGLAGWLMEYTSRDSDQQW